MAFYAFASNIEQAGKGAQVPPPSLKGCTRPAVLIVGNFLSASFGTRGVCEDLAVALKSAGWTVLTTSHRPGRFARLTDFLLTVWRQRHHYRVAQVDVYSGLAFVWAELVCCVLRMARRPYVLTLHGGNLPVFAITSSERVRRLLRCSIAVTAPSPYLLEQMREYRHDIILLPNPLDLTKYSFKRRQHPTPNLMWLRAFHHIYDPSLAVRVLSRLVHEFAGIRLLMIGPDKGDGSLEAMKRLALELGVAERLTCTGPVPKDEIPHMLQQGDIFINTTRVDNTPVSILEAMASGLSIISTNVGGIPYILEDEHDGLLVPPGDDAAMAKAVQRLLTEDGLNERLCSNARRKVQEYDWPNILPKWERLLIGAAGEHTS
jgi:glycosyltransferase involved in cell wall biosynthesis